MRRPSRLTRWVGAALLVALGLAYTWVTWRYFTLRVPGGNDFMTHYAAWQAYFQEGLNPYSDEAAKYTQQAIRGRAALPGEDENRLAYPFYSVVLHGPFILLDYALARALYMTLLQAALVAGVALTLDQLAWRPPTWLLAGVLAWALLNYPEARGIILGQFAIFGFAALAGTLALLRRRRDMAAGALLVVTTVKPTLVFLVIPFLLAWAAVTRRWRFALGFGGTLAGVTLGSLALLPSWIGDWLYRVQTYSGYTVGQSPVWLLTHMALPALGTGGEWAISAGLLALLLAGWWRSLRVAPSGSGPTEAGGDFHWGLGLTLVVSSLIVPRSATTNYVMLLLPTLWVFAALDRRVRGGRWLLLAVLLVSLVGYWWLHLATVVGNQEQPIVFVPWPLALLVVMLTARGWLRDDARQAQLWPSVASAAAPALS